MARSRLVAASLLSSCLAWTVALAEEPAPLVVGSEGVAVPKKVKDLRPKYPPEAVAQGLRGIVILDLVIDATGAVESVQVVRSVPGLDDAAIVAAHQWRYEPVKVKGRAVRVRMTVPITFSLALPTLVRDPGVPELRQGVAPVFPAGATGGGKATVAVVLEADGRIAVRGTTAGSPEPWTATLLKALETWRFSPEGNDNVVSFRIEAEFTPAKGSQPSGVTLRATGLKVSEARAEAAAAPATTAAPATASPAAPAPAQASPTPAASAPAATAPAATPPAATPAPAPVTTAHGSPSTPASAPAPAVPGPTRTAPAATPPPAAAAPTPAVPAVTAAAANPAGTAAPPLEVLAAPLPQLPPENGISAVRDVVLQPGVPELARGRHPVPPPVARLAGATGTVEVAFSVSAAGTTTIQKVAGPDLLKKAAEQTVASWVFRRTRADRAYLIAFFDYGQDKATAAVRPQPEQALAPTPAAAATAAPASVAPGAGTAGAGASGTALPPVGGTPASAPAGPAANPAAPQQPAAPVAPATPAVPAAPAAHGVPAAPAAHGAPTTPAPPAAPKP